MGIEKWYDISRSVFNSAEDVVWLFQSRVQAMRGGTERRLLEKHPGFDTSRLRRTHVSITRVDEATHGKDYDGNYLLEIRSEAEL